MHIKSNNERFILLTFRALLCTLILLCCLCAVRAERLPLRVYTSADGLASSAITRIVRDSRGFLWFCTRDGLSRFDGVRFTTYSLGQYLSHPTISQILETRRGVYLISTAGGGIYRFDPNAVPHINQTPNNLKGNRVTLNVEKVCDTSVGVLFEDRAGQLWAGTNEGLYQITESGNRLSFNRVEIKQMPSEQTSAVNGFQEGSDGSLWLNTGWGVLRRLPDGRMIRYGINNKPEHERVTSLQQDKNGRIWIGHSEGLYVFNPEPLASLSGLGNYTTRPMMLSKNLNRNMITGITLPQKTGEAFAYTVADGLANNAVESLLQTSDGRMWIASNGGLTVFDGSRFQSYAAQGLTEENSGVLAEDIDGNLWIGNLSGGAARLALNGMTSFNKADGLGSLFDTRVHGIYEDQNGQIYVVNGDSFISSPNGGGFNTVRPNIPAGAKYSWTSSVAFPDSRSEWWLLNRNGLHRFSNVKNLDELASRRPIVYTQRNGLKSNFLYRIFEDSSGNLWISTRSDNLNLNGLTKWERATETFHVFSEAEGFPSSKSPASFAQDKAGNIWVGFYEGGLARFTDGHFTTFTTDDGVPAGFITGLYTDSVGSLWISSTAGGLSRLDNPTAIKPRFVNYTTENGLSSNNARCIVEDLSGNIYVGTVHGVDSLNPKTGRVHHYGLAEGLADDFVTVAHRDRQGALWFGTQRGVSKLKPGTEGVKRSPPILIGGLRIAGDKHAVSELGQVEVNAGELSYTQNNLQIDFFSLSFALGNNIHYQYKLEGADEDWNSPVEQRTVAYAKLSPGEYRFMVRAVNSDGLISERPALLTFKISAPFWRRWWFIALIVTIAGLGVFALDRYRVKKTNQVKIALDQSKQSEREMRVSETRYRTLAETASDAIITIDETSKIVYVNEAVEKMFGYKTEEIIGEQLTLLMAERFRASHEAGLNRYLKTNQKNIAWAAVELPGQHKSGTEIPLELSFGEFEKDGKRFFTGIARDITERKKSEADLKRAREERFAELERVRKRIATDLHDDIGSSLTQISLLSEVVNQRIGTDEKPITMPLAMIANTSRELVDSMSDIVWAINPKKDNLSDLTGRMRRFAADVLTASNIKFNWHAQDLEKDIPVGANVRREIYLIFKESVNNIVKHSDCTAADIELHLDNENLELILRDNGKGFDITGKSDGHGLTSMSERAAGLGGKVNVVSEPEKGTVISLKVSLEQHLSGNNVNH